MPSDTAALPLVSICIPVKNGATRLPRCLESIRAVDYPQDLIEVIIADGRSTDGTADVARKYGATVLDNPGEIVATGRNVSFGAARGELIASTDDDCIVPANWIRQAVDEFSDPNLGAVGGISILPDTAPTWARAANYVFRQASLAGYSVQSDHLFDGKAEDLPGCNTFYRASAFREIGEFDAKLVTAEDVDFNQRLSDRGWALRAKTSLMVWHDKRPSPKGLFRQLRRFAEGRIQLSRKLPGSLRTLHKLAGWLVLPSSFVALAALLIWPAQVLGLLTLVWIACAVKALADKEGISTALLILPALTVMLLAWSFGYWKEQLFPMGSTTGR